MTALNGILQVRRDTAANWTTADPVLADGEIGLETDTDRFKIGDGVAAWSAIADYYTAGAGGGGLTNVVDDATPQLGGDLDVNGSAIVDATDNIVQVNDNLDVVGNVTVSGTVDGRDVAVDGTKLDGIEAGATADQTGAEIKAAYEGEADTNAYDDAAVSKLAGIEVSADVTDEANVTAALNGATLMGITGAAGDGVLVQDASDANNLRKVLWENLPGAGGGVDTSGTPAATEYARFTDADTIEGRTPAQVLADIGAQTQGNILDDLAGLTQAADQLPYFDSATTAATTPLSSFARTLLDDADAAAARTTIGADITSASDAADLTRITAVTRSGTTDTIADADHLVTVIYDNAAAVAVTIPTGLTVGSQGLLVSAGAGGLTLTTTGLTLVGSSPSVGIAQNEGIYWEITASNTLLVLGGTV